MTPRARLIHPVAVTLRFADDSAPPVALPAQVSWGQHGDANFQTHVHTIYYRGSLTFLAATINPLLRTRSLVQARVLTIAGHDYTDAALVISRLTPLAHCGVPRLIKAFFSAEVVPLANEIVTSDLLDIQS